MNRRTNVTQKEREGQRRIKSPCVAAASIKKARKLSAFTIVNKVSENQLLMECRPNVQNLEYHRSEVFLYYTHAPSEAKGFH